VRIYDDNVSLSRLVGGNKAFIERAIPHIAGLMCTSMEEVVRSSDIIVVAHDCRDGRERLLGLITPDQLVIDLVKIIPRCGRRPFAYEGICW
jgi:GDP-mannose 6-dehydrogenase